MFLVITRFIPDNFSQLKNRSRLKCCSLEDKWTHKFPVGKKKAVPNIHEVSLNNYRNQFL